jgi:hypothetical protein
MEPGSGSFSHNDYSAWPKPSVDLWGLHFTVSGNTAYLFGKHVKLTQSTRYRIMQTATKLSFVIGLLLIAYTASLLSDEVTIRKLAIHGAMFATWIIITATWLFTATLHATIRDLHMLGSAQSASGKQD